MKKLFYLPLLTLTLFASELSTLIEKAQKNELVAIYKAKLESASKSYGATKSAYMPKIDFGASGQLFSPKDTLGAGQVYNAHVDASLVILDGFRRENILDEKTQLRRSSEYDLAQIKKRSLPTSCNTLL